MATRVGKCGKKSLFYVSDVHRTCQSMREGIDARRLTRKLTRRLPLCWPTLETIQFLQAWTALSSIPDLRNDASGKGATSL
jgi:hypothetical protein